MDVAELISMVTDGLTPEDSIKVKAALERDAVKTRVGLLKTAKDIEASQARIQELEAALDGVNADGSPRGFRVWYNAYSKAIFDNDQLLRKANEKYGENAVQKLIEGTLTLPPASPGSTPQGGLPGITGADDLRRMVTEIVIDAVAKHVTPPLASGVKGTVSVVQKHLNAGRKTMLDMDAISNLARSKYAENMDLAYDEWDKPERDRLEVEAKKQAEIDKEKEIQRRVTEELAKRNLPSSFPGGADLTPSSLTPRSDAERSKFDRNAMQRDLMTTFMNSGERQAA